MRCRKTERKKGRQRKRGRNETRLRKKGRRSEKKSNCKSDEEVQRL